VWREAEIIEVLGAATAQRFNRVYNVTGPGNFCDEASGERTGMNVLHLSDRDVSADDEALSEELAAARQVLFEIRAARVRPHRDDKIITAWNGMLISALARAGMVLSEPQWVDDAARAAAFILAQLFSGEGRLLRRSRNGESGIAGFAEDYAYLACALLDLYAADFKPDRLIRALSLAEELFELFQDTETGLLYDVARDGERLVTRPRTSWDGAMPAAGSVAMDVSLRLYLLTGDDRWRARAERLFEALSSELRRYPAGYTRLLQSAAWLLEPTREVVITGMPGDPSTKAMLDVVRRSFSPETVALFHSAAKPEALPKIAPFVRGMLPRGEGACAYICQDFMCREPLTDPVELARILAKPPSR
jgi:uncharacterized protein YyaL (SSP411 family)